MPEQICIHTAQGMICYLNATGVSKDPTYKVSVYRLGAAAPEQVFEAPVGDLQPGQPKLDALFAVAKRLGRDRRVQDLKLESWHTITRKP